MPKNLKLEVPAQLVMMKEMLEKSFEEFIDNLKDYTLLYKKSKKGLA